MQGNKSRISTRELLDLLAGKLDQNRFAENHRRMIRRRALLAEIKTEIGCHTLRATGITAYLKNGGKLEVAQQMAAHEPSRTTGLYDRRNDEVFARRGGEDRDLASLERGM